MGKADGCTGAGHCATLGVCRGAQGCTGGACWKPATCKNAWYQLPSGAQAAMSALRTPVLFNSIAKPVAEHAHDIGAHSAASIDAAHAADVVRVVFLKRQVVQDLMEWRKRLDRTSSLPPPWERNAGGPAIIAQPASARASSVSESQRSGQASMQQSCRQAEPCFTLAQTCLTSASSVACASAVSHRTGSNHYAHARLHTEPASEVPEVSVSEEPAHDSLSGKFCSRHRLGKPLHRLEVIGQHVIAQGQPQADLQPVGLSLAPQRQLHDSALCHPQEQTASSPAHLADGEGRAQGSGVAAAVAAAEGAVVALMAPNGSWASGVVVSAEHGYIVTVAHLLSNRRQTSGQQGQPVSSMASYAGSSHKDGSVSSQHLVKNSHISGAPPESRSGHDSTDALQQQRCSSAHRQPQQNGGIMVQLWASGSAVDSQSMTPALSGRACPAAARPHDSSKPFWAAASIVRCFEGALDVAVLQLDSVELRGCLREVSLRPEGDAAFRQGAQIAVLGFPLLSPRLGFGLCVTAGIIAKVGLSLSYQQAWCGVDQRYHCISVHPPTEGCGIQVVRLSKASSALPEAMPESGDACMLITGAAVHPGAQLDDSEVHMQLLGDVSAHIRSSDIAPVP